LFTLKLMDAPRLEAVKARAVRSGYNAASGENIGGRALNVTGEGCYVSIYTGADTATYVDVARFSDLPNGSCDQRSARKMVAALMKA